MVKYGLIEDYRFFEWLEQNGEAVCNLEAEALAHAIDTSCKAKAEIVRQDELESGRRALLNLGHTFGHALETAAGYDGRLLHGEAVAIGTVMAYNLSARLGMCDEGDPVRVEQHFASIGLMTQAAMIEPRLEYSIDEMIAVMRRDKKAQDDKMTFILPESIGRAVICKDVDEAQVRIVLAESLGVDNIAQAGNVAPNNSNNNDNNNDSSSIAK